MLINEFFEHFRFRSFFIEKELICKLLVLFIRTSKSDWLSLTIDEGISTFSLEPSEPLLLELNEIKDDFAYPINEVTELNDYIGKKISNIYEYRIEGIEEGCIGIYFDCEGSGFSVLESDGCLSIFNGVYDSFQEKVFLSKLEI